jgi:hypothetical protein
MIECKKSESFNCQYCFTPIVTCFDDGTKIGRQISSCVHYSNGEQKFADTRRTGQEVGRDHYEH